MLIIHPHSMTTPGDATFCIYLILNSKSGIRYMNWTSVVIITHQMSRSFKLRFSCIKSFWDLLGNRKGLLDGGRNQFSYKEFTLYVWSSATRWIVATAMEDKEHNLQRARSYTCVLSGLPSDIAGGFRVATMFAYVWGVLQHTHKTCIISAHQVFHRHCPLL